MQLASDGPAETQSSSGAPVKLGGELLVRSVDPKDPRLNGPVARVAVGAGKRAGGTGRLACQRVYMAAGAGLCLALAPSGVEYRARIFDRRYHVRHELTLSGLPSRARVSPGGRWGAVTTFTTGDSYTTPGQFSTRTWIIDMRSGRRTADLERFEAVKDGKRFDSPDFNYWGVTFARDEDTFYATLSTGGQRYLVKGSLREAARGGRPQERRMPVPVARRPAAGLQEARRRGGGLAPARPRSRRVAATWRSRSGARSTTRQSG